MTTRRRLALTSTALCALTMLAACGGDEGAAGGDVASIGDGSTPTTVGTDAGDGETSPADREEAMLDFAECMRDHGVDMPDPEVSGDGGGGVVVLEQDAADGDFQEAEEACQPILEDAMGDLEIDPEREAEMREELLEFSECMRDQGIDMPDPVFGDDGRVTMEAGPGEDVEVPDEEELERASEACGREGPGVVFDSAGPDEGEDG